MATERQKEAARRTIAKTRQAPSARAHGKDVPRQDQGMSTARRYDIDVSESSWRDLAKGGEDRRS